MITKLRFPKFDANITEGMLGVWYMKEGDPVQLDAPLVEIITDKATFDLEAECEGTLRRIIAREKSHVPVGYIIALIGGEGDELPDVSQENEAVVAEHRKTALEVRAKRDAGKPVRRRADRVRVRAIPAARRLAREAGIDIGAVPPSNGSPVITEEDVRRYLESRSDKGGAA